MDSFRLGLLAKGAASAIAIAVVVFALAGRVEYWQGWVFVVIETAVIFFILSRINPKLAKERMRFLSNKGTKPWDKLFFLVYTLAFCATLITACLEAGRNGNQLPIVVCAAGLAILAIGHFIEATARTTNPYYSSVVRIQRDRGQKVYQGGLYQVVRHPGYAGAVIYTLGAAIGLGSALAIIPALVGVAALIVRTHLEDETLQKELAGYKQFARKTRYRLLPGVW